MNLNAVIALDSGNFDAELAAADTPVLVDFWAPWCGPCRSMERPFAALAAELIGRVTFAKVNVDESPDLARRYQVRSIPTLLVFVRGRVSHSMVGAESVEVLRELALSHTVS